MNPKVVVTGRGLVTPIGTGLQANLEALRQGKNGIQFMQQWKDVGLESQVAGKIDVDHLECPLFERKRLRFMPDSAKLAVAAAYEAIAEAGYTMETLPGDRMAVINATAGSSYKEIHEDLADFERHHQVRKVSPFTVPRIMPSSAVSNLSLLFGIKGESYDVSCACTSGAISIIAGARLIQSGEYDIVMVGGSEEVSWEEALAFNAMRALSHTYNDTPERASRPFDKDRDGFVIAEAGGILILESEEHAKKRNAKIIAELTSFSSNSNATDMVVPDEASCAAIMMKAIQRAGLTPSDVDYINTHGTSTPIGDPVELRAIKDVFEDNNAHPAINSTKSQTGHCIGAAGAIEAIFTTLMIEHSFVSPSRNADNLDEEFAWADIVHEPRMNVPIRHALSNSFGFGGTNACLIFSQYK